MDASLPALRVAEGDVAPAAGDLFADGVSMKDGDVRRTSVLRHRLVVLPDRIAAHKGLRAEAPGSESKEASPWPPSTRRAPLDCPVPLVRRDSQPELPGRPSVLDVATVTRIAQAATMAHGRLRQIQALRPPRRGPAPILRRESSHPGGFLEFGTCSHAKPRHPVQAGSGGDVLHGGADVYDCLSARHRPEHGREIQTQPLGKGFPTAHGAHGHRRVQRGASRADRGSITCPRRLPGTAGAGRKEARWRSKDRSPW